MSDSEAHWYVYVYIDPRNFEEFYYGKGKGKRKEAHIFQEGDSEKIKRIKAIQKEGHQPIIKVIAKGLAEQEALLVEKTLIWKLGKNLLNDSSGHFADKFRPHDTFHLDLAGFDFKNGLYYVNVGEGMHRCWADCSKFGFLSAGQDPKWSDPIRTLLPGDIVVAYLKNKGYVGIGRVTQKAMRVSEFRKAGELLKVSDLEVPNIFENSGNEKSEYLVEVDWIVKVSQETAKWKPKSGLFTSQLIKASLQNQKVTREFLESEFGIDLRGLLLEEERIISN